MSKLLILKGLPASGKTTYAKGLVDKHGYKRVNKDDLRAMLDNSKWSRENERFIKAVRDLIIVEALSAGQNVVVDDTNLAGDHIKHIIDLTESFKPEYEEKFFDTPYSVCVERDLARPSPVGKKVIRRMYEQSKHLYITEYKPDLNKPECIIVDIDGTLAHMNGRSPYEYDKVNTDVVDGVVKDLVFRYRNTDIMAETPSCYVIIVSGRDDTCKQETVDWLAANDIHYDEIHMRDHTRVDDRGHKIDDTIIKRDIYNQWIKDRYNVKFVLDDRNRVVDMWRSLGLKVLQVGEGDF